MKSALYDLRRDLLVEQPRVHREDLEEGWQEAMTILDHRGMALVMGGAPAVVSHPLGPPVVTGTSISVDTMLNAPTRITRFIMDLTLQRFVADRIFTNAGGVTGGAVVYDIAQANELYATRDVEIVAPGSEFPLITSDRLAPATALVEKWGGKVFITDEARERNNSALLTNQLRQLSNTIVRKINQKAIAVLEAAVTAYTRTFVGVSWTTPTTTAAGTVTPAITPARDFGEAARISETEEMGVSYNLWIIHPTQYAKLINLYGAAGLNDLLSAMNLSIYVSNRVTAGTAYVVDGTTTGEMRVEKPLGTETWREPETERTWVQSSVRPVMYVTNPFGILKVTGI
jgi:hypothetical protein